MTAEETKELILASASPRRKALLEKLNLSFKIIPSEIDEPENTNCKPEEFVKQLALAKAQEIANKLNYNAIVIGADTTVVVEGLSLGKPIDHNDAYKMLKILSNREHKVITGIAIIDTSTNTIMVDHVESEVYFKNLTDEEINEYIKTGEPMDKAGAYAIQGLASTFITGINGCYNNIVGLPIYKLGIMLKEFNIDLLKRSIKN